MDPGPTHPPGASVPEHRTGPSSGSHRTVLAPSVLEKVREHDPAALAAFFDRYFDQVYATAYRLLGERAAAEDVTQEVFYKVHRAAHQLDPGRDPAPWLTAITYNACRDLWRTTEHRLSKRSDSIDDDLLLAGRLTTGHNDPERNLLAEERRQRVQEAVQRLPEQLRTAVVLFEYGGMNHQEIAEITGVSHAAARKRYSRALAALAKLLEGIV
jgi:RNA polymerase sigma-70 factor (ECF subfamily)